MSRDKVTTKGEIKRVARRVGRLERAYRAAELAGDDQRANALWIAVEIENGRLIGRRVG